MNDDQVNGRIDEAKGEVKKVAGRVMGNRKLERSGKIQKTHGKARAKFGDLREGFKEADLDAMTPRRHTTKRGPAD